MDPNPPPVDVSDACSTRASVYCYSTTGVDGKPGQVCSETMADCTANAGDGDANVTGPCVETY